MAFDTKLDVDEERRVVQHEEVRAAVHDEVRSELLRSGVAPVPETRLEAHEVARELRKEAHDDVGRTSMEIHVARGVARISQLFDYVFFLIYAVIGTEILLDLFGAHESSGFKRLIDQLSNPLLSPFRGLLNPLPIGDYKLNISYVVGLLAYMFVHFAINALLGLVARRRAEI
jgi:uncharacterized protein YggT (Ycf19 family)